MVPLPEQVLQSLRDAETRAMEGSDSEDSESDSDDEDLSDEEAQCFGGDVEDDEEFAVGNMPEYVANAWQVGGL